MFVSCDCVRELWRRDRDIEQLLMNAREELSKYNRHLSGSMGQVQKNCQKFMLIKNLSNIFSNIYCQQKNCQKKFSSHNITCTCMCRYILAYMYITLSL